MKVLATLLGVLAVLTSCSSTEANQRELERRRAEQANRRNELRGMVRSFGNTIESAGREIAQRSDDLAVRRESVQFRFAVIGAARATLGYGETLGGGLDLWALAFQLRDYFRTGAGVDRFGPQTEIAAAAADRALEQLTRAATKYHGLENVDAAIADLESYAREFPMTEGYGRLPLKRDLLTRGGEGAFAWVGRLSLDRLNPFAPVSSGISEGAAAIEGFSRVAERFNDTVEGLPRQVGWTFELLLYDLQESTVAHDISRFTDAVEQLPEMPLRVRTELEAAVRELEPELETVRATLAEARGTADALQGTGTSFDAAAQSLEAMAAQLDTTLVTFQRTLEVLGVNDETPAPPPDPNAPRTRPFDVLEFEQAARAITAMAAQLGDTLDGLRDLVAADEVGVRIHDVEQSTKSAVWSAALAAVVVLAALFALLGVYRSWSARWTSKTSP